MANFGQNNGYGFGATGSGGGGGGISSLVNGLYVDGANGKLGGFLIEDTTIELEEQVFTMKNDDFGVQLRLEYFGSALLKAGLSGLYVDGSSNVAHLGNVFNDNGGLMLDVDLNAIRMVADNGNQELFRIDLGTRSFAMGDVNNINSTSKLFIEDDSDPYVLLQAGGHMGFRASRSSGGNGQVAVGDYDNSVNNTRMILDDADRFVTIGSGASLMLSLSYGTWYQMGDISEAFGGGQLNVKDNFQSIEAKYSDGQMLTLEWGLNEYKMGDISNVVNGMHLFINDATRQFTIGSDNATIGRSLFLDQMNHVYQMGDLDVTNNGTRARVTDDSLSFIADVQGNEMIRASQLDGIYFLGDTSPLGNASCLRIADISQSIYLGTGIVPYGVTMTPSTLVYGGPASENYLSLNIATGSFAMGDISGVGNGLYFTMEDSVGAAAITTSAGIMFRAIQSTGLYQLGDISTTLNGSRLSVNDSTQVILLQAANGISTTAVGGGQGKWKLGVQIAAASTLNTTQYIEIEVDGVTYKLATMN